MTNDTTVRDTFYQVGLDLLSQEALQTLQSSGISKRHYNSKTGESEEVEYTHGLRP